MQAVLTNGGPHQGSLFADGAPDKRAADLRNVGEELKRVFSMPDTASMASHGRLCPTSRIRKKSASQTRPLVGRSRTGSEDGRYVEQLEKRIEEKDVVIGMLRGEFPQRNDELVRRTERERVTNILIRGLQNLALQLQPGRSRSADVLQDDPLMTGSEASTA